MNNEINDIMKTSINDIKNLIDVNVVIGKPITFEDTLVVPISKVKCAFISGGMEKKDTLNRKDPVTSALASNLTITPVAFLVKEEMGVKVLHLENDTHVLEYILDSGIDVVKQVIDIFKKKE